jgi:2-octaprenyl-6-methoxyphenol hydroxylase
MLGAVLAYGQLVTAMQQVWFDLCARQPQRLHARFGVAVTALKDLEHGVEVDAGVVETFDLVVQAEGGVFGAQTRKAVSRDYGQSAWVGQVSLEEAKPGLAVERFTLGGPVALLPLVSSPAGPLQASLVWCTKANADAVAPLDDAQRVAVLNSLLPATAGRVVAISQLTRFALGLNAEPTLVRQRQIRIGNAAQTLHPVAGQGLNLGLRDVFGLVDALAGSTDVERSLRRIEWTRAPDRWSMIATIDFLARSFTWPGLGAARGAALAMLQATTPLKSALARRMMFGQR